MKDPFRKDSVAAVQFRDIESFNHVNSYPLYGWWSDIRRYIHSLKNDLLSFFSQRFSNCETIHVLFSYSSRSGMDLNSI